MALFQKLTADFYYDSSENLLARVSYQPFPNGPVKVNTLSAEQFSSCFIKEQDKTTIQRVGPLPYQMYDVIHYAKDSYVLAFVLDQAKRPMFYEMRDQNQTTFRGLIVYPSLFFTADIGSGILRCLRCFALKEAKRNEVFEATELYQYPFGNVNSFDGKVCLGGNQLTGITGYADAIEKITNLFFSAGSNNDLYSGNTKAISQYDLILKCRKKFPSSCLSPTRMTVNQLLESIVKEKKG